MKFAQFVVGTVIVGALVGWMAPGQSDGAPAPEATFSSGPTVQPHHSARPARRGGEEVLERADDGHFYADVVVDGTSAHMLVDTGASVVALTGEDAEAMGVHWDQRDVMPVARGASGDVYGVPVMIDRLELGGIEVRKVEAIVVPDGLSVSLLGQSFLSHIPKVEMGQQTMTLGG